MFLILPKSEKSHKWHFIRCDLALSAILDAYTERGSLIGFTHINKKVKIALLEILIITDHLPYSMREIKINTC